jgi:hypothetical protein
MAAGQGGGGRRERARARRRADAVVPPGGLLDELELGVVPVLLGSGRKLFGDLEGHVELELTRLVEAPDVTYMRFRVAR